MNATVATDAGLAPRGALTGEPQWLALEPEPVYAVLHTPAAHTWTSRAALLLPAFGWDGECSYRRRRDWATQMASSGIMSARIDFPGQENSAGSALTAHRVESWVAAAAETARWLRERSGCERLAVIGIGIAGLIAYQAAAGEAAIDDLILWGVRASGRAHVRELRAYAAVTAQSTDGGDAPGIGDAGGEAAHADGAIGIGGHVISVESLATLQSIDLSTLELPDAARRRVLLIGRDRHGIDPKLRDHLIASGADVALLRSDEYQALMSPPDIGSTPTKTVSASIRWLVAAGDSAAGAADTDLTAAATATTATTATTAASAPRADLFSDASGAALPRATSAVGFEHEGVPIRERTTTVETFAGTLRGLISEPATDAPAPYCLVTVNSGALRHTGPNRLFVEIGRRAAARGIPAARFDLPGLGDSEGSAIRSFERTDEDDRTSLAVLEAIYDHIESLGVARRFVAAGFSLGGYLTVRVATTDSRVAGALSVNPTGLVWTDKQRKRVLKDLIAQAGPEALAAGPASTGSPHGPRPLRYRLERVARALDAGLRRRLARSDRLWRLEHRREITGLNDRLDEIARSGTQMLLLLSENEQLLRMLELPQTASRLARCRGIRVQRLASDDHLLRPLWVQETVAESFVSALVELGAEGVRQATETSDHGPDWGLRAASDAQRTAH